MRQTAIRMIEDDDACAPVAMPSGVRIRRLSLTNFRSYGRLDVALDGRPVALSGANGAGKTNLLEAISLLGPGRGLRNARLDELPRLDGDGGWAVSARLDAAGDERSLGVGGVAGAEIDRRVCRIDGQAASGPTAFADCVRLVWLTPAQDRLFLEGAGERRRFLDRMAMALDPAIARVSSDYETVMRQRQRLLDERSRDDRWIGALELRMAESGVALAAARRDMAGALVAAAVEDEGAFPSADLAIEGDIEAALAYGPAIDVEEEFAARLKACRRIDAEAGRATVGPHRSDLLVTHRAKGRAARLCSTGEQKALLIGLVLANARALSLKPGGAPLILLLDEIAAHLDEERRAALFDILDQLGFQSFMTGTDASLFEAWGRRAQAFEVRDGVVTEI